jgi:hypothetical protein
MKAATGSTAKCKNFVGWMSRKDTLGGMEIVEKKIKFKKKSNSFEEHLCAQLPLSVLQKTPRT